LRQANIARLPEYKDKHGERCHPNDDGSDWSLSDWSNACLGELGEAANIIKKIRRGDMTLDEARPLLSKELADVQTYLDLLAFRADVDLGQATIDKWNEISKRVGINLRLGPNGHYRVESDGDDFYGKDGTKACCMGATIPHYGHSRSCHKGRL
jgi:NTP pyrophosphatase (non-canonical NTP hydrolase)